MTIVPNLAVTGVLAILVSVALAAWAVWFAQRRHGGLMLIGLSVLLLLVGGGIAPPLIGVVAAVVGTGIGREPSNDAGTLTRAMAAAWPWALIACVIGYLSLVPGVVLLSEFAGFDNAYVVSALTAFAFTTLILSLVSARAADRLRASAVNGRGAATAGGGSRPAH
jgi:hypothetical protein